LGVRHQRRITVGHLVCTSPTSGTVTVISGGVGLDGTNTYRYQYDPACGAAQVPPTPTPAPGVWLAGVCETHDGFSDDGWMTIGSETPSTLYAGTGPENDWIPVTVPGPNWVLSRQNINDIAAVLHLTDYHDIWFKVDDGGQPAHLRSMIIDRDKLMAGQCAVP
jgi:hypothetical protein